MSTWWIDEPMVLGSSNPTDDDLIRLRAEGFSVLICLLDDKKEHPGYDVKAAARADWSRHSIPVEDFHPPSLDQLRNLSLLLGRVPQSAKVGIHCEGGRGRTGTMGAAYWITRGLTATAAIARVRAARPGAIETCEQELVLYKFADLLKAEVTNNPSA